MIMYRVCLLILLLFITGCNKKDPIGGIYQTADGRMSGIVMENTLHLMIGHDTMIIYDLKTDKVFAIDSTVIRTYKALFNSSLNRTGYEPFKIPINLAPDLEYGGTLMVSFTNNDSFRFGGFYFMNPGKEICQEIFNQWEDLYFGNLETKLRMKYKKE